MSAAFAFKSFYWISPRGLCGSGRRVSMDKLFALVHSALGLVLALSPIALWPVCSKVSADGGHMSCWYMGVFIVVLGVVVCAVALGCVASRSLWLRALSWFLSVAVVIVLHLVSTGSLRIAGDGWAVGLCGSDAMACRAIMLPHVTWITIILCLASVFWAICSIVVGKR